MDTKIIKSKRRSISLQILPDHTLVVKAPFLMPDFMIKKFINDHTDWVEKQKQRMAKKVISERRYLDGETFLFLGKEYKLKIGNYKEIRLSEDFLLFPNFLEFRIKKELSNWYINQAKEIITTQVNKYAQEMGTEFTSLSFSDTRSKWGSCTHDNKLQFSWRLVMAPILVLNYVVIHELAHTKEKNHSRSFWSKVRLFNPSYKQQIKWLHTHGNTLFI
jgi:predicted metal-dependent hydrolase